MRPWTAAVAVALLLASTTLSAAAFPPEPPTPPLPQRWIISLRPDADTVHALTQLAPLGLVLHRDRALTVGAYRALVVEPSFATTDAATDVDHAVHALVQRDPIAAAAKIATALHSVAAHVDVDTPVRVAAPPGVWDVRGAPPADACVTRDEKPRNWGLDRIDQPALPLDGVYASPCLPRSANRSIVNYVVDTGIFVKHEEFQGRATWGTTVVSGASDEDKNGHGTFVAGVIGGRTCGVYKQAQLVAVKALDDKGQGSTSDVITALQWVANQVGESDQIAIVNLSIGGFYSRSLNDAVNAGAKNGLIMIVAAGNEGINACLTSPASATGAIAVGATDRNDLIAKFSNIGACVEILAPGVNVTSASIRSKTAYVVESGTSFASPHVAGLLGLYAATSLLPALVERFDERGGWEAVAAKDALTKTLYDRAVKDQVTIPFSVFSPTPNLLAQVWPS
ncbi:hypothetical protein AMAG_13539 [Allomyces macrogynus ATCC 38327]|uniref:Peptidase S8/S53 domain-containing protein n=1 Tax=Allomyces macrogynus (strain ATCC 38327) TaxID=578462 RepID=A0A0L0T2L7_ALLM3|nr:hypothetical protein AMAG_13539 [Allomyces macrogynus ATCC 38327]|eukprot:KNE68900.1 hypothetical protein AMAG_13539 [Allomyces macrogynus ATCC 38327]